MSAFIFNTSAPFNIHIAYLDVNGRNFSDKEISNLRCSRNEKLVISGYLFTEAPEDFIITASKSSVLPEIL